MVEVFFMRRAGCKIHLLPPSQRLLSRAGFVPVRTSCPSATAFMSDVFVISQHGKRLGKGEQEETTSGRKNPRERLRSGSGSALSPCPGVNCAICSCWEAALPTPLSLSLSLLTAPRAASPPCWRVLLAGPGFLGKPSPVVCRQREQPWAPLWGILRARGFAPRGWKGVLSDPQPSPPSSSHQLLAVLQESALVLPSGRWFHPWASPTAWELFLWLWFPPQGQCPGSQAPRVALD